ncbi:hypothetical protein ACSYAD_33265 [Acaryochloris marina NIES-2412]|uniref:hypothetical protein n=1 Tax=Acaryochloris marina TaxID=155978 RepID=UPI0040595FF8
MKRLTVLWVTVSHDFCGVSVVNLQASLPSLTILPSSLNGLSQALSMSVLWCSWVTIPSSARARKNWQLRQGASQWI